MDEFVRQLIGRHQNIEEDVRYLIVTNTLHHRDETINVIRSESNGKYIGEKINTHPFVYNVKMALAYANVTKATFKIWVEEI